MKINVSLHFYQLFYRLKCTSHMQIDLLCQVIAKINTFIFLFKPLYLQKHSFASSDSLVLLGLYVAQAEAAGEPSFKPWDLWAPTSFLLSHFNLTLSFVLRGLYKIFLLPKKRGLTELLGYSLCSSWCWLANTPGIAAPVLASWLYLKFDLWGLLGNSVLGLLGRRLLAFGYESPSDCFV